MESAEKIIQFNQEFTRRGDYERFKASKIPRQHLAIVSCMDARLLELLPAALGLKNGDAISIRIAGAMVEPNSDALNSLLVATQALGATQIMIIGHDDCGMLNFSHPSLPSVKGFDDVEISVQNSVRVVKDHPVMKSSSIEVTGYVIDPSTGKLRSVS